jgi:hypothetical protein
MGKEMGRRCRFSLFFSSIAAVASIDSVCSSVSQLLPTHMGHLDHSLSARDLSPLRRWSSVPRHCSAFSPFASCNRANLKHVSNSHQLLQRAPFSFLLPATAVLPAARPPFPNSSCRRLTILPLVEPDASQRFYRLFKNILRVTESSSTSSSGFTGGDEATTEVKRRKIRFQTTATMLLVAFPLLSSAPA